MRTVDSWQGREKELAALFRETPDNFDVTFDAFLIDNQPGDPIDGKHVSALAMFLRQVGDLSQRYNKRVWLGPEANNWILSQWSSVKGNISDALFGVAPAEPFLTWKNLWDSDRPLPERFSALLLALAKRTDLLRQGGTS